MTSSNRNIIEKCDVCGGDNPEPSIDKFIFQCRFCGFEKNKIQAGHTDNSNLIFTDDVNAYFKDKYSQLKKDETFELIVPVSRFYKTPQPQAGQVNFFKSKNIMFLLEQHGFQFVSRKSRFSTQLNLLVRKL